MNNTLKAALLIIIFMLAGLQSLYAILFHLNGVFADQWDLLPILKTYYDGGNWLDAAFERHSEHFRASAYLIMVFLADLSQWNLLWEVYAIVFFNLFSFAILYHLAIKPLTADLRTLQFYAIILMAGIYFSLTHSINLVWTWQLAVHISVFGMLLALWGLGRERINALSFFIAIFGALFSSFAFSCGFAIWPMGLLLIFLNRNLGAAGKGIYAFLWCAIAFAMLSYFYMVLGKSLPQGIVYSPDKIFIFIMYGLSMAVSFFSRDLSLLVSILALILAVFISVKVYMADKSEKQWQLFNIAVALMAFSLIVLFLVALGRLEFGYSQARSARYIIFSQFFWIGLVLQFCNHVFIAEKLKFKNCSRYLISFLLLTTFVSSIRGANDGYDMHIKYNSVVYHSFLSADDNKRDQILADATLEYFPHYPPRPILEERIAFLKEHHLNLYRDKQE